MAAILDGIDAVLAWIGSGLGQNSDYYCNIETADSRHAFATRDGALMSVIRVHGATELVGKEQFARIHRGLTESLNPSLSRIGHAVQVFFSYDAKTVKKEIENIFIPARQTTERLGLDLGDLFDERINHLSKFCSSESCFFVLWTRPNSLTKQQLQASIEKKNRCPTRSSITKNAASTKYLCCYS